MRFCWGISQKIVGDGGFARRTRIRDRNGDESGIDAGLERSFWDGTDNGKAIGCQ